MKLIDIRRANLRSVLGLGAICGLGFDATLAPFAAPVAHAQNVQSTQVSPQDKVKWLNEQQRALVALDPNDGWQWLDGGLAWRRVDGDGTGPKPTASDIVTVHYAGTFTDGREFDSSFKRGKPATFPLGNLIKAWQMAIPQMGVGDTIELVAPARLAYGPVGKGPIPGGATLKCKVQLLGIGAPRGKAPPPAVKATSTTKIGS